MTRNGDTLSYAYDALNRRCSKAVATAATACTATSSSNPTVWYTYDLTGRLMEANDNSASVAAVSGSFTSVTLNAGYDALNQPISTNWNPAPAQAAVTGGSVAFNHGYDRNDRRITQSANDNSWWSYPASAANISYSANALNQYSAVGAVTPAYDANGNLTYDGSFTYCYDAESHLTGILSAGSCASPVTTVASYAYDAQGRRKSKNVGGTTTLYVTDADNREVLEYDGTGALKTAYAYGPGSNDVLNRIDLAGGTRQTMLPDIQGSIIGTLDSATGILTKAGYQAFGENPALTGGSFNYTAQRLDAETAGSAAQPSGLYYYRARMYSPTLGRFLQADPAGYGAGVNLYAYVNNDPLNLTDPDGLINNCYNAGNCPTAILPTPTLSSLWKDSEIRALTYEVGGLGLAAGCVIVCPALIGGGAATVGTGEAVIGGEVATTATTTVAAPPTFTATIGNTALDLTADPLAGTTRQILIPSEMPGLVGSPITDFDTSIPSATTNLGKAITIIGGGLALRNNLSQPAK